MPASAVSPQLARAHHLASGELENLRKYLGRGGFIFASGCCTNPQFPAAWRRELGRVFPGESVRPIPYDHLIYRSFYKMDRIRSANVVADNIQHIFAVTEQTGEGTRSTAQMVRELSRTAEELKASVSRFKIA